MVQTGEQRRHGFFGEAIGVISTAGQRRGEAHAASIDTVFATTRIAAPGMGPTETIARLKAFAALSDVKAPGRPRRVVVQARYGLRAGALVLEAGDGRRLWGKALGAVIAECGGQWLLVIDGAAGASIGDGAAARQAVAAAMRSDLGTVADGVLTLARAPGETALLASQLFAERAPEICAGGARLDDPRAGSGAASPEMAALARRAARVEGPPPICSASSDGAPLLLAAVPSRRHIAGVTFLGA